MDTKELQLDEFGEYLVKSSVCRENHIRFYVYWVRSFFRRIDKWPADEWQILLQRFVNELTDEPNIEDWQVQQAERAVRLYFNNFRGGDGLQGAAHVEIGADGQVKVVDLLSAVREALRVRRYSYRTEQTYLDWIRRFVFYLAKRENKHDVPEVRRTGRPVEDSAEEHLPQDVRVTPEKIRDFLAWLAVQRHVAASTQNQAFNALLFMGRDVLKMDLGPLRDGGRGECSPPYTAEATQADT
mgnify:CR=1 FL=1